MMADLIKHLTIEQGVMVIICLSFLLALIAVWVVDFINRRGKGNGNQTSRYR